MKNKTLNINIWMYCFVSIMLLTLMIDYFTYFFGNHYLIYLVISGLILCYFGYCLRHKIKIVNNFEKADIIFFLFLLVIAILTIVFPDRSFDTFNYHLYLQQNPFGDKINFDFFAGKNLNSYSYAFPDRMFYLFRFFLGYRLGVILNYLLIIIIYVQVKETIKKLIPHSHSIFRVVVSTLIATSLSLIDIVDSYYVDLISVVLLLEITRLVLFCPLDEKENNTILFAYFGLLFGFTFVVKISNAVLLVLLFMIYVLKNRNILKCINLKNILITLFSLFLPFVLYLVYTYLQTGNPVFPFYNTIFKSEYFRNRNWLDTRFGPSRIREVFIWPLIILFDSARCDDINIVEPIWGYGYIIAIIYALYYSYKLLKKQKFDKNRLLFFATTVLFYLFWSKFQLGYSRYGLVVLILGSISTYIFIYDIIRNKRYFLIGIMLPLMFYHFSYVGTNYMYKNQDWIYNNYYNNKVKDYNYNLKNLFSKGNETTIQFEKDSVWAIFYYNAGLAQFINDEIPIINVVASADNSYTRDLLNEKLQKASHIYTLVDSLDFNNFIVNINKTKYKIIKVEKVFTSTISGDPSHFVYVFEVGLRDNSKQNNYEIFESEKEYDVSEKNNISLFLGLAKDTNHTYIEDFPVSIIGIKDGKEEVLDNLMIDKNGSMHSLKYNVENYDTLKIVSLDANSQKIIGNWMMSLNVETD